MATIMYTTGNGYRCGCCRRTDTDTFYFDSDDIEYAIRECIDIAKRADWDFYISQIFEFTSEQMDEADLETKIMAAVEQAERDADKQERINSLKAQIKSIDGWFATLEQTKQDKTAEREKLTAELLKLEA